MKSTLIAVVYEIKFLLDFHVCKIGANFCSYYYLRLKKFAPINQ